MYMRGKIIDYDWEEDSYDLLYCDGPFFGDDKPDPELQYLTMARHRDPNRHRRLRGRDLEDAEEGKISSSSAPKATGKFYLRDVPSGLTASAAAVTSNRRAWSPALDLRVRPASH